MPSSPSAADARLSQFRHLNLHYVFKPPGRLQEWEARKARLRLHLLVSCGLWPAPERTPLEARVFGRIEREGYSVEKVYFESLPGFYVTGNLYRPMGKTGPFPGVLSPHGHWSEGRLAHEPNGSVPGRAINLARQGCVVFSYDMVGYNDSLQIAHHWGDDRLALWGLSPMGLQLWNSIRSIDFLQSLSDVDPDRIACTGASGGGTQTFMVMAVDERVKAAAPVCMVSAYMQGGCVCENAPLLRVDTFNTEIAALMAPRLLLIVAATGDWTSHNIEEECPDIRSIYRLYGAEDRLECVRFDAPHNYNLQSREAVYAFFGKWLQGIEDPAGLRETPFEVEPKEELRVFPDGKLPPGAKSGEEVMAEFIAASKAQMRRLWPTSTEGLAAFRDTCAPAWHEMLMASLPPARQVRRFPIGETVRFAGHGGQPCEARRFLLSREQVGDRIGLLELSRMGAPVKGAQVVLLVPAEPSQVWQGNQPSPVAFHLLEQGYQLFAVEPFLTGPGATPREIPANLNFFTTYNRTDTAERVQDILTALTAVRNRTGASRVDLLGLGEGGVWTLLARSVADHAVGATAADLAAFELDDEQEYLRRCFIPIICRLGGLRTALCLAAPQPLLLYNSGQEDFRWLRALYRGASAGTLRIFRGWPGDVTLVNWILGSREGRK